MLQQLIDSVSKTRKKKKNKKEEMKFYRKQLELVERQEQSLPLK
mgnify:CR=1 FL=1